MKLEYIEGMKYQTAADYRVQTPVTGYDIDHEYFKLSKDGQLWVKRGYAWDGPSGPVFHTKSAMIPSLEHDVFCQMMRCMMIDYEKWQDIINEFFRVRCIEKGMWEWRANMWHAAVEAADAGNPSQGPDRPILTAP